VLEFIINLYAFNLIIELILMPLLLFIGAMGALAETKKEYMPVKKVIHSVLAAWVIFTIIFTFYNIVIHYKSLATIDNLRAFILPPSLTFAFLPFIYFLALYTAYELIFIRLNIFLKNDKALARFAKEQIFILCLMNLRKLNRFAKENALEFTRLHDKNEVLNMIQDFNKKTC